MLPPPPAILVTLSLSCGAIVDNFCAHYESVAGKSISPLKAFGHLDSKSWTFGVAMGWPYITLAWCISILSLGIAPLVVTLLCRQSILNYYGYFTTKTVAALKRDESNPKSPTAGVASDVSAAPPKKEGAKAQPPITTETIGDERLYIQDAIAARHIAAARRAIDTLYGKVDQLETEMFNKLDLKDVPPDLELVWYINRLCVALRFSLVSILMRSRAAIDATLDLLSALELFAETAIHDIPNSWRESNLGELAKKYYEANQ